MAPLRAVELVAVSGDGAIMARSSEAGAGAAATWRGLVSRVPADVDSLHHAGPLTPTIDVIKQDEDALVRSAAGADAGARAGDKGKAASGKMGDFAGGDAGDDAACDGEDTGAAAPGDGGSGSSDGGRCGGGRGGGGGKDGMDERTASGWRGFP
jgi:hypothetical protein